MHQSTRWIPSCTHAAHARPFSLLAQPKLASAPHNCRLENEGVERSRLLSLDMGKACPLPLQCWSTPPTRTRRLPRSGMDGQRSSSIWTASSSPHARTITAEVRGPIISAKMSASSAGRDRMRKRRAMLMAAWRGARRHARRYCRSAAGCDSDCYEELVRHKQMRHLLRHTAGHCAIYTVAMWHCCRHLGVQ